MINYPDFAVFTKRLFNQIIDYMFCPNEGAINYLRPDLNEFILNAYPGIKSKHVFQIDKTILKPVIDETYIIITEDQILGKDVLVDEINIMNENFIVIFIYKNGLDKKCDNLEMLMNIYLSIYSLLYSEDYINYQLGVPITSKIKISLIAEYVIFIEALLTVYSPKHTLDLIDKYKSGHSFCCNFNVTIRNKKTNKTILIKELVDKIYDKFSLYVGASAFAYTLIEGSIYSTTVDLLIKGEILREYNIFPD